VTAGTAWPKGEFESPGDSPGLLLWQVTNQLQRQMRAVLAPHGLTHVQFVLLANLCWLVRNGTPVSQIDLATHAATDPMMTSQVIRSLERAGLVGRSRHLADRRAWALQPTATGKARLKRALPDVERTDHAFFSDLGVRDEHLLSVLARLRLRHRTPAKQSA
jgi:DNA-binding MarR family transcriptional regulator